MTRVEAELRYRSERESPPRLLPILLQASTRVPVRPLRGGAGSVREMRGGGARAVAGFIHVGEHYFYRGLAAAVALSRPDAKSRKHRKTLRHCLARLHLSAANSPHNFGPARGPARSRSGAGDGQI